MTQRADIILAEMEGNVDALVDWLSNHDSSIRSLALGALAKIDKLDDAALDSALADEDRDVRCRAIELAVDRIKHSLAPLLSDEDDLVVETAAWALGERQDQAPEIITALAAVACDHDISICREAAVAALGAIGSIEGLPAILRGLDDRAPVRRRAVLALAPFDTPEVTAALEAATKDRDRQVRQAAEDLI